jgi:hypothetical protein
MSDPSLHQLERDVEAARAKLAGHLSTLRSPATYSEFSSELKYEALDMKDALVDKAKSSAQSTIDTFVEDLKARAAANPAAALAIGAGIAWRLVQRPPIATALIGAGLYSLFRTIPTHGTHGNARTTDEYLTQARDRLAEQASDLAGTVKDSASAIGEAAAEKATEFATAVKERALAMGEAATELATSVKQSASSMGQAGQEKATELVGAARSQAQHWSEEVRSSIGQVAGNASRLGSEASRTLEDMSGESMMVAEAPSRVAATTDEWRRPIQETAFSQEARDKFLLGAAGVAVVAALSIACQRRLSEPGRRSTRIAVRKPARSNKNLCGAVARRVRDANSPSRLRMQLDDVCEECQQHDDRQRHTQKPQNTGSSHVLLPLCYFLAHLTHQSMSEFLKRPRSSIAAQPLGSRHSFLAILAIEKSG